VTALPAVRVRDYAKHRLLLEGRHGAGDENSGSIVAGIVRKITWFQPAEILGFSDRHLRRIRERYHEFGYDGLFDRVGHLPPNVFP
jgi:hypothetical protein